MNRIIPLLVYLWIAAATAVLAIVIAAALGYADLQAAVPTVDRVQRHTITVPLTGHRHAIDNAIHNVRQG